MPRKQPFVNAQLVRDVEYLERNSPDLLVDMGLLMHIMTKRQWAGGYQGWTNVPVTWLSRSTRMGHKRVEEALARLEGWGMITAMSTNGRKGPQALNYRYDLRPDYVQLAPEPEVAEYEVEEVLNPTPEPEPPKRVRRTRPPLQSDKDGAYGEVYVFSPKTWRMVPVRTAPTDYATAPICQTCGKVYHSTEGRGKAEDECAGCYIEHSINEALEEGVPTLTITSPFGKRTFTTQEMEELVDKQ